jgi:hypothetical protein
MLTAAMTFPKSSDHLITRPSVATIKRRRRKVPPSSKRTWARYKPPSKWTVWLAFLLAIAIHIGAVAIVDPSRDDHWARLWAKRSSALENERPEERGD